MYNSDKHLYALKWETLFFWYIFPFFMWNHSIVTSHLTAAALDEGFACPSNPTSDRHGIYSRVGDHLNERRYAVIQPRHGRALFIFGGCQWKSGDLPLLGEQSERMKEEEWFETFYNHIPPSTHPPGKWCWLFFRKLHFFKGLWLVASVLLVHLLLGHSPL